MKRTLTIALTVIALGAAAFGIKACFFSKPKNTGLITAPVAYSDLEKSVLATGQLYPYQLVSVGAQASGQVTALKVNVGDIVKKGDIIAEIDSKTQTNNLQTAQARLDDSKSQLVSAQASLANAQSNFARQQTLFNADAGSKADFDTAAAQLKSAQSNVASINAQIDQAQIAVKTASVTLGYTAITAPIDGTILAIVTKQGQTVNANQTAPTIVKMGELDRMTVKAQISEADVIKIKPGMQVYFTVLGDPDKKYFATLRSIEPAPITYATDSDTPTSTQTSNAIYYYGLFDTENPDGTLRPSMTAQVSVVLQNARHVLTMPSSALGRKGKGGGYTVQVDTGKDKPEPRKVKVGLNDGTNVQILEGLKEGEKVVIAEKGAGGQSQGGNRQGGGNSNPLAGGGRGPRGLGR
jgi:macrolide-specific efflux system membrane fusion protein